MRKVCTTVARLSVKLRPDRPTYYCCHNSKMASFPAHYALWYLGYQLDKPLGNLLISRKSRNGGSQQVCELIQTPADQSWTGAGLCWAHEQKKTHQLTSTRPRLRSQWLENGTCLPTVHPLNYQIYKKKRFGSKKFWSKLNYWII